MLADYHVHSAHSDDSQAPMEDMIRQALALGLDEICFTEHVDYGVDTVTNCDYAAYFAELDAMRRQYGDRIAVLGGIEFGIQTGTVERYQAEFDRWPFDFVILSCHQVDNLEFWRNDYQQGKTQDQYQAAYYREILEVCRRYKNYSVLGHLDVIKRYDRARPYPDEKILPLAEQILRQTIADGRGIEVNTSSFRYGLEDLTPSRRLLELYRDLGGEILTFGSDAHDPSALGDHIPQVKAELKAMGFRSFCTFRRMRPVYHEL